MSAQGLGSRAIIGRFFDRIDQNVGTEWIPDVSMLFTSDQASEEYKWLGMAPAMREWIGGRLAKTFRENGIIISNKTFEATIEVLLDEIRRDKTGQVMVRIDEMADRANSHWAKLLTTLIVNGEAAVGYDGQYFFDTDHAEGDSGAQSNDLTYDVATPAAPTAAEFESAVLSAIAAVIGIKDDQGEPMNENASQFVVMVPVNMMAAGAAALKNPVILDGGSAIRTNTITSLGGFSFRLVVNPRLTWTTKFAVFAGGASAAFIRQEEEGVTVDAIAEGSEEEFKNKRHLYGIKAIRNVGYGMWQRAALITLT